MAKQYRNIAAKALGRKLKSCEHVHHLDLDRTNNKNNNLVIVDAKYHRQLHTKINNRDYEDIKPYEIEQERVVSLSGNLVKLFDYTKPARFAGYIKKLIIQGLGGLDSPDTDKIYFINRKTLRIKFINGREYEVSCKLVKGKTN